ncbi:hypothetical protein QQ045_002623 [Rhodiola kirilowii]
MGKRRKRSSKTCRMDQLSDDLLIHILSFLDNLAEISRTAILSRRWRNLWRYNTRLDFSPMYLLPNDMLLSTSHASYIAWVNNFIEARNAIPELPPVKQLRLMYGLDDKYRCDIDRWIDFAIVNRVEKLRLEFAAYTEHLSSPADMYKLSEECWYRAPSGLSSLKCLKSLFLSSVNVSNQFIEFILSSCPLLEDLTLHYAGPYTNLNVSGVPSLQLKRLRIDIADGFALNKLCAPRLTSLLYQSPQFSPQTIDVPMLTDLTIGHRIGRAQRIMKYLDHFWSYLPQLEKLDLMMGEPRRFKLKQQQLPKLVKLKYLKMRFTGDTDPIFYRIVNFINCCPLLETFAFQVTEATKIFWVLLFSAVKVFLINMASLSIVTLLDILFFLMVCLQIYYVEQFRRRPLSIHRRGRIQEWRKAEEKEEESGCFKCLKVLQLYGAKGKILDQEVLRYIINKAPNLEKLIIDTRVLYKCYFFDSSESEILKDVKAKARKLCLNSPLEVDITVY